MSTSAPETAAITARYQAFAAEARGRSPQYEDLAVAAGRDQPVLAFLATLPPAKQQPNLLFAAARYLLGEPPDTAADHEEGHFTLAENGTRAIAHADPHGTWLRWLP
jgi:Uncharacterized protein conserved in bacteria (DUF2332)